MREVSAKQTIEHDSADVPNDFMITVNNMNIFEKEMGI